MVLFLLTFGQAQQHHLVSLFSSMWWPDSISNSKLVIFLPDFKLSSLISQISVLDPALRSLKALAVHVAQNHRMSLWFSTKTSANASVKMESRKAEFYLSSHGTLKQILANVQTDSSSGKLMEAVFQNQFLNYR